MDKIKKHFQEMASTFDARIIKSVPFYVDMLEALVSSLPFKKSQRIKVADLGCGTGRISEKIKEHYPKAAITRVDFSDNMIKIAENKLRRYKGIKYVVSDCRDFDFSSGYDAVLSSLTLHHLHKEKEKKSFYKNVFKGLRAGGVFFNADLVLGSSAYLQRLNLEKWRAFLERSLSKKEIEERKKRYCGQDHPFRLMDEIVWLRQAGFRNVDVIWKYYHFAVYGGQK